MEERSTRITIERAEVDDPRSIRNVALEANIDAWSESDYSAEIRRADSIVLKAVLTGRIVGILVSRLIPGATDRSDAELYNIAVSSDSRRAGIGTKLLRGLVSTLRQKDVGNLWLEVRESNIEAILFYEKQGFVAEITRTNFYSNPPENAVIMRLRIKESLDVTGG